jgi:F0F1-type ATP synthase epsilon subunit
VREPLRLTIRTPHDVILGEPVRSARIPTQSGQLGLRPGMEPMVLAIEPGLIIVRLDGGDRFVATAGGLLAAGREASTVYTPYGVTGSSEDEVLAALDVALETPGSELAARRQLGELERHILRELGERRAVRGHRG